MKPGNYMGNGAAQAVAVPVLMSGLKARENSPGTPAVSASGPVFPGRLLVLSLFLTAAAIAWPWIRLLRASGPVLDLTVAVGTALVLMFVIAWGVTAKRALTYRRSLVQRAATAATERQTMLQEQELLRAILDNLPDHIYAKDRRGRFVLNNLAHARSLGLETTQEMVGKSDFDYFPNDLATQFFSDEQALIASGEPILNQEQFIPVYGKPGECYWVSASKVLWKDRDGNILGTAGITRNIHHSKLTQEALRKSEDKLRQFTTQLERSNRELQDFAYVASHDLQEPLRKIVVFGERLREKCQEGLSPEGLDYLERMRKAASRMQVLITDLLAFSRVTTKAQPFTTVDLARTARDVASDLEAALQACGGRIEIGALPVVEGETVQMRQLMQNLLGNAIKFRKPDEPPVIRVDSVIVKLRRSRSDAAEADYCEIRVSDNGIGFEEKYLDRIFNVFQRLHTRSEYEGTGMGLAIARKIVLYHGGEITARSKPGHGSTFIVTLPVTQPQGSV
ncbi:MAG: ATP-binding protein [Verrucomicrobiota bacterium]